MRPFNVKLLCCIGLLTGLAIVMGCGSGGDLLDETATRYSAYATPQDTGGDTQEIDVIQDDCNGTAEDFLPFDVKITVTTDSTAASFYVNSYDVYLRPNEGTYCEQDTPATGCIMEDLTAAELPPLTGTVLNPRHFSYSSPLIQKNQIISLDGLLVWTQCDKDYFVYTVLGTDPMYIEEITDPTTGLGIGIFENQTIDFTYDMQVVLHCTTIEGEDFTIVTPWTPVHFSDFDNC